MKKKPKQPCEKHCPERTAECKITCEKWQKYEQEKKDYLHERDLEWQHNCDLETHVTATVRKNRRKGGRK